MKYRRLFFLVLLTMTAFAFNSILARLAISNQEIGPVSFALLRLLSGSIILIIIVVYRLGLNSLFRIKPNFKGIIGLSSYMVELIGLGFNSLTFISTI